MYSRNHSIWYSSVSYIYVSTYIEDTFNWFSNSNLCWLINISLLGFIKGMVWTAKCVLIFWNSTLNRFEEGWVVIRSTLKFKLVLIFFNFPLSVYRDLLLKEIILVQKWPIPLSLLNSKKWNKNDFLFKFSDVHLFYATLQWFGQRLNQNLHVKVWRWRNWNIDV